MQRRREKGVKDLEREIHKSEIMTLDKEITALEGKLGIKGDSKKKQKLKRRYAKENYDADMVDFLDSISEQVHNASSLTVLSLLPIF